MSGSANLTYYQKKRDVILNRAKDQGSRQEINIETYLKKKKTKGDNMEKTYHNMSEEKKQRLTEYQKNYR